MPRKQMEPDEVAKSAERQLIDLKQAQNKKMQEVMKQRDDIMSKGRTIQAIAYAVGNTYKEVFPGGEGFIELRIKTPDSIATKARNEFTEILNEIQENPKINQSEIIKKISKIDFKDILAFTVITTDPPKKFRTGSDELNTKLTELAEELEATSKRMKEHKRFIDTNEKKMRDLSNKINGLKSKASTLNTKKEIDKEIGNLQKELLNIKNPTEMQELINKLSDVMKQETKEEISGKLKSTTDEYMTTTDNIDYGEKNFERTEETYYKTLRELQYEMSSYFVSNLAKFSTFKFWGTKEIRTPKLIQKPGFRAVNTGYIVVFSNDKNKFQVKFEAQGKGKLDYDDTEFSTLGALYHEEQKTKDGLISKKTEMPDFTIIGAERTKKIEYDVRRKYQEIASIEDLAEISDNKIIKKAYNELKKYNEKVKSEILDKYGDNYLSEKEIKRKINDAFLATKENLIQNEIEDKINEKLNSFADSDFVKEKIQNDEKLSKIYNEEKKKMENNSVGLSEIEHEARVKVMYHAKEKEIEEYAKNSIPIFSRVNISSNPQEEVTVYTYTVGESIYRYFYNKLNGLKDENGKYKYEPQEQQKRALLKLTGLFEEDNSNFYTYNREKEQFGGLDER